MRRTIKYLKGIDVLKERGAKVRVGVTSNEAVYDSLESAGYWWKADAQEWTNEAKPQRGNKSNFPLEGAGSSENLVQIRLIAGEQHINRVLSDLREFCDGRGWTFLQQSSAYTADSGGVRCYISFIVNDQPEGNDE